MAELKIDENKTIKISHLKNSVFNQEFLIKKIVQRFLIKGVNGILTSNISLKVRFIIMIDNY